MMDKFQGIKHFTEDLMCKKFLFVDAKSEENLTVQ